MNAKERLVHETLKLHEWLEVAGGLQGRPFLFNRRICLGCQRVEWQAYNLEWYQEYDVDKIRLMKGFLHESQRAGRPARQRTNGDHSGKQVGVPGKNGKTVGVTCNPPIGRLKKGAQAPVIGEDGLVIKHRIPPMLKRSYSRRKKMGRSCYG